MKAKTLNQQYNIKACNLYTNFCLVSAEKQKSDPKLRKQQLKKYKHQNFQIAFQEEKSQLDANVRG